MRINTVHLALVLLVAGGNGLGLSAASVRQHHAFVVGTCETTFAQTGFVPPNQVQFSVNGTCNITRLGEAAVHIDQLATFYPDGTGSSIATITYTFANGEVLVASSTSEAGAPNAQGVFIFTATQLFTGGTGRFANASGSSPWLVGFANVITEEGGFAFSAELSY
jgi:hypothetical protein